MADETVPAAVPARLREAREYLGLSVEQVATILRCDPALIKAVEDGDAIPRPKSLQMLATLYRRPVPWLCGETTWQPAEAQLRSVENLTEGDREAVLDFLEFLGSSGAPRLCARREITSDE